MGCYMGFLEVLIEASYTKFRRKNHTTSLIFQAQFPSTSSQYTAKRLAVKQMYYKS